MGDIHQPGLQGRPNRRARGPDARRADQRGPRVVRCDDEDGEYGTQCAQRQVKGPDHRPVGQPAADMFPTTMPRPNTMSATGTSARDSPATSVIVVVM